MKTVVCYLSININISTVENNLKALKAITKVFILERCEVKKRDYSFCLAVLDMNTGNTRRKAALNELIQKVVFIVKSR